MITVKGSSSDSAPGEDASVPTPPDLRRELDELYRAHASSVARLARRLLAGVGDVDDVVHDVFLVAHRRLHELEEPAKAGAWLRQITLYVVKEQRRRARWRTWLVRPIEMPEPVAPGASPEALAERQQAIRRVEAALAALREEHRTVLVLFELEGVSGAEIAALLGISIDTVWVWLHRARKAVAKQLGEEGA